MAVEELGRGRASGAPAAPRVLFVLHNYATRWPGGTEIYARGLARELHGLGCEMSLLYPVPVRSSGELGLVRERDGALRLLELRVDAAVSFADQISRPAVEAQFEALLVREVFDVVHFQHTWHHLPLSLFGVARRRARAVCATLHDAWLLCHQTHLLPPGSLDLCSGPEGVDKCARCFFAGRPAPRPPELELLRELVGLRQQVAGAALGCCDVVAAPTRYLRELHERAGLGVGRIAHAPLGLEAVQPQPAKPHSELVFGFIGSLSPVKDPLGLVRAFSRVSGDARLVLHGPGDEGAVRQLSALLGAEPRAEYRGAFAPAELGEVLAEIDVLVLPSRVENYPLVLREALSAGIPVIATRTGGIPEIVEHGVDGLLCEPGNESELAACMQAFVDDPGLARHLRARLRPIKSMREDAREWLQRYHALLRPAPR
jgi:glycosyltransferase involved in cell wall biosynthesis